MFCLSNALGSGSEVFNSNQSRSTINFVRLLFVIIVDVTDVTGKWLLNEIFYGSNLITTKTIICGKSFKNLRKFKKINSECCQV